MVAKEINKAVCCVVSFYSYIISHTEKTKRDPCQSYQAKKILCVRRSVRHGAFKTRGGIGLNDGAAKHSLFLLRE